MTPEDTHLLMSVTKSVIAVLAGIVVEQGRLDPNALITQYVPEVKVLDHRETLRGHLCFALTTGVSIPEFS